MDLYKYANELGEATTKLNVPFTPKIMTDIKKISISLGLLHEEITEEVANRFPNAEYHVLYLAKLAVTQDIEDTEEHLECLKKWASKHGNLAVRTGYYQTYGGKRVHINNYHIPYTEPAGNILEDGQIEDNEDTFSYVWNWDGSILRDHEDDDSKNNDLNLLTWVPCNHTNHGQVVKPF
jgi:hypothetical protein